MLDENREPVIVDFSAARTTESDKDGYTVVRTRGYVAPEIGDSIRQTAAYTNSIDVFSYSRVLFAMALLHSPLDNSKHGIKSPPITIPLPDGLKTLIEECQSFEDILGRFQSGKIYFSCSGELSDENDEDVENKCLAALQKYRAKIEKSES
jgi:serine/threonine protein kinase